jgi:hypothetical protein
MCENAERRDGVALRGNTMPAGDGQSGIVSA